MEGFFSVEVAPLPKSQNQIVGLLREASEKLTTRGEHPETGVAVKLAVGAWANTTHDSHKKISKRTGLRINFLNFSLLLSQMLMVVNSSAPH